MTQSFYLHPGSPGRSRQEGREMADEIMAYDMKLRKMVTMENHERVTMKNGMKAWRGRSAESGVTVFKIIGK